MPRCGSCTRTAVWQGSHEASRDCLRVGTLEALSAADYRPPLPSRVSEGSCQAGTLLGQAALGDSCEPGSQVRLGHPDPPSHLTCCLHVKTPEAEAISLPSVNADANATWASQAAEESLELQASLKGVRFWMPAASTRSLVQTALGWLDCRRPCRRPLASLHGAHTVAHT